MKFVSKHSNYRVVLKRGLPAEPLTGRAAEPGVYVKFEDGIFKTDDQDMIDMLMKHPGFNSDYIIADEEGKDPYADNREEKEPAHDMTEIKFGTPVGRKGGKKKVTFTKEQKAVLQEMASGMAIEMLQKMAENTKTSEENGEAPKATPAKEETKVAKAATKTTTAKKTTSKSETKKE